MRGSENKRLRRAAAATPGLFRFRVQAGVFFDTAGTGGRRVIVCFLLVADGTATTLRAAIDAFDVVQAAARTFDAPVTEDHTNGHPREGQGKDSQSEQDC